MKNQQSSFWKNPRPFHGGGHGASSRKIARPIATKRPMHVIFKSSRASGKWSFLHQTHRARVEEIKERTAKRFNVKIYRFANVGNHCHALVQVRHRRDLQNFMRVFAQAVALLVTGASKGKSVGKFWDALAFTRIVEWGRDWETMLDYLSKNIFEGAGVPRDRVNQWFKQKREILRRAREKNA